MEAKAPPLAASTETTRPSRHTNSNRHTSRSGCSSSLCVEPSREEFEFTFVSEFDGDAPRSVEEPLLDASAISVSSSYFLAGGGALGTCVSTLSLESSSEPSWEPPLLPLLLLDSPLLSEFEPPESPEELLTACRTSDHSWGGQFASLLGEDDEEGGDASRFCS